MRPPRTRLGLAALGLYLILFALSTAVGSMAYFHFGDPQHTCASCHEMGGVHSDWSSSAHRTLHCRHCHGGSLTLDAHALSAHLNRVVQHFTGDVSRPIQLTERDLLRAHDACRDCHPQSFADWASSGHAATYSQIFLNAEHNRAEAPDNDCLRCHGMFYDGSIADLVAPLDKSGPWSLNDPSKADQPTIPCLACHQIHSVAGENQPAKSHFYDCREGLYFPATALPSIAFVQDERPVDVAEDPRQRLCLQCHAPSLALAHRLGSSDDRTPVGVHEGLGCLDCHQLHHNSARASCGACHPAASHCGLDVETMDTTFVSATSRHDIHTMACRDCHPQGTPAVKNVEVVIPTEPAGGSGAQRPKKKR